MSDVALTARPACPVCRAPDPPEECRDGWVPGSAPRSVRACPNRHRVDVDKLTRESGVPARYAGTALSAFVVSGLPAAARLAAARDACLRYVDGFRRGRTARGLLLAGPTGTGKTHLLSAVLSELVRRHAVRGIFADFTKVCYDIQAGYDAGGGESEAAVLRPLVSADVLVLDDLGARRPSPFVQDTLYLIINARLSCCAPTLFSTNHPLEPEVVVPAGPHSRALQGQLPVAPADAFEPLRDRVGPRIYSRLFEAAEEVRLDGCADFRRMRR